MNSDDQMSSSAAGSMVEGNPPAVRVYTVCDESRYVIVRNVPALGCIDELVKLFGQFGPIEEYRLLDEEECEPFTDVYWIKFVHISNASAGLQRESLMSSSSWEIYCKSVMLLNMKLFQIRRTSWRNGDIRC